MSASRAETHPQPAAQPTVASSHLPLATPRGSKAARTPEKGTLMTAANRQKSTFQYPSSLEEPPKSRHISKNSRCTLSTEKSQIHASTYRKGTCLESLDEAFENRAWKTELAGQSENHQTPYSAQRRCSPPKQKLAEKKRAQKRRHRSTLLGAASQEDFGGTRCRLGRRRAATPTRAQKTENECKTHIHIHYTYTYIHIYAYIH